MHCSEGREEPLTVVRRVKESVWISSGTKRWSVQSHWGLLLVKLWLNRLVCGLTCHLADVMQRCTPGSGSPLWHHWWVWLQVQQVSLQPAAESVLKVWIDADVASSSQSSQRSWGVASRLEELVETLQDRRRRADQAVWLQLQQAEDAIVVRKTEESREAGSEVSSHLALLSGVREVIRSYWGPCKDPHLSVQLSHLQKVCYNITSHGSQESRFTSFTLFYDFIMITDWNVCQNTTFDAIKAQMYDR